MARGISTHWRKDGPTSKASQAAFLAAQARATCANEGKPGEERTFCPRHFYRCCQPTWQGR